MAPVRSDVGSRRRSNRTPEFGKALLVQITGCRDWCQSLVKKNSEGGIVNRRLRDDAPPRRIRNPLVHERYLRFGNIMSLRDNGGPIGDILNSNYKTGPRSHWINELPCSAVCRAAYHQRIITTDKRRT